MVRCTHGGTHSVASECFDVELCVCEECESSALSFINTSAVWTPEVKCFYTGELPLSMEARGPLFVCLSALACAFCIVPPLLCVFFFLVCLVVWLFVVYAFVLCFACRVKGGRFSLGLQL